MPICVRCLSSVEERQNRHHDWVCPKHGIVQTTIDDALVATVAIEASDPNPTLVTRRCRVCKELFETADPRHRFCPKCVHPKLAGGRSRR